MTKSKPSKINIGIVWVNPYNKNMGVAALAYSALYIINNVLKSLNKKANIFVIGSSYARADKLLINGDKIKFNNIQGHNFLHWKTLAAFCVYPRRLHVKQLLNLDYIFDVAEGDSFTDIYGEERFKRILSSKKFFLFLRKKQMLLPQTIGPFTCQNNESNAFQTMNKLQKVLSRDKQSYNYTARFLQESNIGESIDMAFYLPFKKKNIKNGKVNVGVNVSGLLWNGGYTKNNQFNLKANYKKLTKKILQVLLEDKNIQVHLVPHVIPDDFEVENDYLTSQKIADKYPGIIVSDIFKNPIEAKSYISGLDFFIGARMHACIAAFSTGVPVFPIAYSRKFNGLFIDTLKYKWIGDCVNENEETIVAAFKTAYSEQRKLKYAMTRAKNSIIGPRLKELKNTISEFIN